MATKGQDVNVVTILHATKSKSSRGQVEAAGQLVAARKAALLQQVHATGRGRGKVGRAYHRNQRRNGRDEAQKER